jgi:hypothetical protein
MEYWSIGVMECWVMKDRKPTPWNRSVWFVIVLVGVLLAHRATLAFAAVAESWKSDWEKTVEAAKKEGQLTLYGSQRSKSPACLIAVPMWRSG